MLTEPESKRHSQPNTNAAPFRTPPREGSTIMNVVSGIGSNAMARPIKMRSSVTATTPSHPGRRYWSSGRRAARGGGTTSQLLAEYSRARSVFFVGAGLTATGTVRPMWPSMPGSGRPAAASYFSRWGTMTGYTGRTAGRIVVGVDGTAAALIAVRWAVQEALLRQASVHLVHVARQFQRASYSGAPGGPPVGEDGPDPATQLAAAELEASRTLPPGRLSSELIAGSPAKVLIDRSCGAELLVLGTSRQAEPTGGQMSPMVGSTMRACLHGAACPVVVMPTSIELLHQRGPASQLMAPQMPSRRQFKVDGQGPWAWHEVINVSSGQAPRPARLVP